MSDIQMSTLERIGHEKFYSGDKYIYVSYYFNAALALIFFLLDAMARAVLALIGNPFLAKSMLGCANSFIYNSLKLITVRYKDRSMYILF
jgi:hypothetical protein